MDEKCGSVGGGANSKDITDAKLNGEQIEFSFIGERGHDAAAARTLISQGRAFKTTAIAAQSRCRRVRNVLRFVPN